MYTVYAYILSKNTGYFGSYGNATDQDSGEIRLET